MKNVYFIKCTQLNPTHEEKTIGYEDTLEKFESVTSEEYIKAHKNFAGQQPRLNRFAGYRRGLRGNP